MSAPEIPIRPGTPQDWDPVDALLRRAFHEGSDPAAREVGRSIFEPERALVATDGDEVVGHVAAVSRDLTIPGAVVPAAHVTMVSVAATHRRRGLLTRMMHRQLREVHDKGDESFAVLWASEGRIYPRFGYGLASRRYTAEVDTREVVLRRDWQRGPGPAIRLRSGSPTALLDELRTIFDRIRPTRPGWSSRGQAEWRAVLADPESRREGHTERSAVVADGPDRPAGYALLRTRQVVNHNTPACEVTVDEVVADDPAAHTALWEFLLDLDLTAVARHWFLATDDPLLDLVAEPRRLNARLADGLWVRLVNLPAALSARRYSTPVDVVIEVSDPLLPANSGRWRLAGDPHDAACSASASPPDLVCDVRDLAAAYLGGTSLATLAAAGRVTEVTGGALRNASAAFGWHRAPNSIEIF